MPRFLRRGAPRRCAPLPKTVTRMGDFAGGGRAKLAFTANRLLCCADFDDEKGTTMKLRTLLVGVLLAVPVVGSPGPASACAEGEACAWINRICEKVAGPCIP